MSTLRLFIACEKGAALLEYSLLTALVGAATAVAARKVGLSLEQTFLQIAKAISR